MPCFGSNVCFKTENEPKDTARKVTNLTKFPFNSSLFRVRFTCVARRQSVSSLDSRIRRQSAVVIQMTKEVPLGEDEEEKGDVSPGLGSAFSFERTSKAKC